LIGRQYEAQKMTVGGDRKSKAQNGLLIQGDTAEVIAHEHKLGETPSSEPPSSPKAWIERKSGYD
jgi:hypothetical protein